MIKHIVVLTSCVVGFALAASFYYENKRKYKDQLLKTNRRRSKVNHDNKIIEACVSDIESVVAAVEGGFTSLELCSNRVEGGVTPSFGFVREVVKYCYTKSVEVHVLVRPRPGGFVYSSKEFDIILQDTAAMIDLGVDGIVCGILAESGDIAVVRMQALRSLCSDISLTFHRAFDICNNWQTAMGAIISLRCDRLLTSGRAKTAPAGASFLGHLQHTYGSHITIVVAAGIKADNIATLLAESKVSAVHIGSGIDEPIYETVSSDSVDQTAFQDMVMRTSASRQKIADIMEIVYSSWNLPLEDENEES